jgi:hypothetical protein
MLVDMMARRGIAVVAVALTLGACTAERIRVAPTARASTAAPVHNTPSCDGTVATTPYASFATAFNARETRRAAAQFGGDHAFAWWDPSDPPGGVQTQDQLADHFAVLYDLGVRLPTRIHPLPPAGEAPGEGGFIWDDHHGFAGKGEIECQTARLAYLVIDSWTKAIAGRAPVPSPDA